MGLAISSLVDPLLVGKSLAVHGNLFSTYNTGTDTYVRNVVNPLVVSGKNLSGFPVQERGALISPQHVAAAAHATAGVNDVLKFLDVNGTVFTRTVATVTTPIVGEDVAILKLNSALPGTVTPLKLMPVGCQGKYNPFGYRSPGMWVRWGNQTLIVGEMYLPNDVGNRPNGLAFAHYGGSAYANWSHFAVGGDSGSPLFILLPGETVPVLMAAMYLTNGGPEWSQWATTIRAVVQADGHDVSYADLSGFNDM